MPELRDLIRHWAEDPEAPSLYIPPPDIERECAEPFELGRAVFEAVAGIQQYSGEQYAEMIATAVRNTSHNPWEPRPTEPPVEGITHGFTPLSSEEIAERDRADEWAREYYPAYPNRDARIYWGLNSSPITVEDAAPGQAQIDEPSSMWVYPTHFGGLPPDNLPQRVVVQNRLSRDSVMRRILEQGRNEMERGIVIDDVQYGPEGTELANQILGARPGVMQGGEHHRVAAGGACACGFASAFTTDLDNHISLHNNPPEMLHEAHETD